MTSEPCRAKSLCQQDAVKYPSYRNCTYPDYDQKYEKKEFSMKAIFAAVFASMFAAACSDVVDNKGCDLTNLTVKVGSWPNEAAKAKAMEHLNLAKESQAKKDFPACEQHKKQAEEALKL
jgi:hypothetical protein